MRMRRYGATASQHDIDVSRINAQALVMADVLFYQTGDPADHLQLVVNSDGTYGTETLRNAAFRQQTYSENKTSMEHVGYAVAGLAGLGILYWLFRRK